MHQIYEKGVKKKSFISRKAATTSDRRGYFPFHESVVTLTSADTLIARYSAPRGGNKVPRKRSQARPQNLHGAFTAMSYWLLQNDP